MNITLTVLAVITAMGSFESTFKYGNPHGTKPQGALLLACLLWFACHDVTELAESGWHIIACAPLTAVATSHVGLCVYRMRRDHSLDATRHLGRALLILSIAAASVLPLMGAPVVVSSTAQSLTFAFGVVCHLTHRSPTHRVATTE